MITLILISCYPNEHNSIDDLDIIGTRYDDKVNFKSYQTFILHDSIVIIYDSTEQKPDYPTAYANVILNKIRASLIAYGWKEELDKAIVPDVYVESSTWTNKVLGAIYYPGYAFPGFPSPGYPSWGYPSYGTSYYSYNTGSIFLHILDVKNYPNDASAPSILWTCGMNGIINNSKTQSQARLENAINQAFSQSPYLNIN